MKRQGKDATQTMWKALEEIQSAGVSLVKAETLQDESRWTPDYLDNSIYRLREAIQLMESAKAQ